MVKSFGIVEKLDQSWGWVCAKCQLNSEIFSKFFFLHHRIPRSKCNWTQWKTLQNFFFFDPKIWKNQTLHFLYLAEKKFLRTSRPAQIIEEITGNSTKKTVCQSEYPKYLKKNFFHIRVECFLWNIIWKMDFFQIHVGSSVRP